MSLVNNRPNNDEASSSDEDEPRQVTISSCELEVGPSQIRRVIRGMQHAVDCNVLGTDCTTDLCWKMKHILQHTRFCEKRRRENCVVCTEVVAIIVFHGVECQAPICRIPFCRNVKTVLAEYPAGYHFTNMDHLKNNVVNSLRDLRGAAEEREQGIEEPAGLQAEDACNDLVVPTTIN